RDKRAPAGATRGHQHGRRSRSQTAGLELRQPRSATDPRNRLIDLAVGLRDLGELIKQHHEIALIQLHKDSLAVRRVQQHLGASAVAALAEAAIGGHHQIRRQPGDHIAVEPGCQRRSRHQAIVGNHRGALDARRVTQLSDRIVDLAHGYSSTACKAPATSSCSSANTNSTSQPCPHWAAARASPNTQMQMRPKSPSTIVLLALPMSRRRAKRCAALAVTRTMRKNGSRPSAMSPLTMAFEPRMKVALATPVNSETRANPARTSASEFSPPATGLAASKDACRSEPWDSTSWRSADNSAPLSVNVAT